MNFISMRNASALLLFFVRIGLIGCLDSPSVRADASHLLSVREAIDRAKAFHPELKAAAFRELEAQSNIGIARSPFFPSLTFAALDSNGFPGSSGGVGVEGLMGSPYRSGLGVGVVLTQDVFDFGKTSNAVDATKHDAQGQRHDTEVTRYGVYHQVLSAYFDCVSNRAQKETWKNLADDAALVNREVERFVRTGQRSIVDRYLSRIEKEEAETEAADYEVREQISVRRLATLIGSPSDFACPSMDQISDDLGLVPELSENPFVASAKERLQAAQARLRQAKADNLPQINGIASAGYLENSRVVDVQNYSVALGITLPIFDGFRITDTVHRASAFVEENDFLVASAKVGLDELNFRFEETIRSSQVRLQRLNGELDLAREAFRVAKARYFNFQGQLLDVSEALKNLGRVLTDLNTSRARYLETKGVSEVFNGAR